MGFSGDAQWVARAGNAAILWRRLEKQCYEDVPGCGVEDPAGATAT